METLVASLNTVLYMLLVMVLGRWVVGRLPERDTVEPVSVFHVPALHGLSKHLYNRYKKCL